MCSYGLLLPKKGFKKTDLGKVASIFADNSSSGDDEEV